MNEDRRKIEAMGLTYMPPLEPQNDLVAMFNPVQKRAAYLNKNYEENVQKIAKEINHVDWSNNILDQHPIYSILNSSRNNNGQKNLETFQDFQKQNKFFTFDIETLGNALNSNDFSVSEIAAQGFQRNGNGYSPTNENLILVGEPSKAISERIKNIIPQLQEDPYQFNKLNDWEKRSLVDLTRYSTQDIGGVTPASYNYNNGLLTDFTQNTLASNLFENEQMVPSRVINQMDDILLHAQSGLDNLSSSKNGLTPNEMIQRFNQFVETNNNSYFLSYNGDNFDIPKLKQFGEQTGNQPVLLPNKHLDYYRAIQTVYPNQLELHKELNKEAPTPLTGAGKLQAFRSTLGFDTVAAHSATHDIGMEGLAGVVENVNPLISSRIKDNEINIEDGFNQRSGPFSWNNTPIEQGQTLFATGGVRARRDGDLSFVAKYNVDNSQFDPISDSFNTTVINSKTFYQVDGMYDFSNQQSQRYGLRLFDPEKDTYHFIVREGENAIDDIGDFVQNRFHIWDDIDNQTKREIAEGRLTDSARRQYERMFSLEKGGAGRTGGYNAAVRMYDNAEILAERLEGKDKHIQGDDYVDLKQGRLTHDKMMERFEGKFNSLWDSETKTWIHNEREMQNFFRMGSRLTSERNVFTPALAYIGEQLNDPKDRDLAWNHYVNNINESYPMAKENLNLNEFENQRIKFTDIQSGVERNFDFSSWGAVERSIGRYVYTNDIRDNENLTSSIKEDRYRERMNLFIRNLRENNIVSNPIADELININNDSGTVRNSISQATDILQSNVVNYNSSVSQTSLRYNEEIQEISEATNRMMMEQAVKHVRNVKENRVNPMQVTGSRIEFNSEVEKALSRIDQRQLSGLQPNNRTALESVLSNIINNERYGHYHVALTMNNSNNNAQINVYHPNDSVSVMDSLSNGEQHPKALRINMPLAGENGVHQIGNRRVNARRFLDYNNGEFSYTSSSEAIASNYTNNMNRILSDFSNGNIEGANDRARRTLNDSVQNLMGIQRNLTFNDTFEMNNNQSDFFKQGSVDVNSAMVKQLYDTGKLSYDDFQPDAFFNGKLKLNVSVDDLKPEKAYEVSLSAGDWIKENNLPLFAGTNKGDHVSKLMFNELDIRDYLPYGQYTFQGRDNSVQFQNAYLLNEQVQENIKNNANGYINFDEMVTTENQRAWQQQWRGTNPNDAAGFNVKTAFINDGDLLERITSLAEKEDGYNLLQNEGILNNDGSWNHTAIPRIYEQQGLIAQDLSENVKVTEQKILSNTDNYTLFRNTQNGATVQPGQVIGHEMVNGLEQSLRYQGNVPGTVIEQNGRVGVSWEQDAFKYIVEGEKMTDVPISRQLMNAITGDDQVSMVLNPNISKHRDFGMLLSGKAKILSDHAQQLSEELTKATIDAPVSDKASQKALRRLELESQMNQTIKAASTVGLRWDDSTNTFIQDGTPDIKPNRFDEIFDELGISGRTKNNDELAILEARVSKVRNDSKMIDDSGRIVLDVKHDRNGEAIKTYRRNPDDSFQRGGVLWGHREMGVFQDLGLKNTYDSVYETMMQQAQVNNRLNETRGMISSVGAAVNENNPSVQNASTFNINDFRSLPEIYPDENTYKGTLFDRDYIEDIKGNQNNLGYWLELPTAQQTNGETLHITANIDGVKNERKKLDRLFIPFTNLEGADGHIYLREMQKNIANIYRRASEVEGSGSITERANALNKLQTSVDQYFNQTVKDITSSKGQTGSSVLRAQMPNSGSGLFKLLDPAVSMDLDGEFTFINPRDAEALGVHDKLKSIEDARAAGNTVDDLYTMNTRYPVFHSDAVQISKLRLSENANRGEFLTTSWMSNLMKADSDGDYNNIVVLDDEKVQSEWKKRYNLQEQQRQDAYMNQLEKSSRSGREFSAASVLGESDSFVPFDPNTQDEMAAKIGKRVVGRASNLNLVMRQTADQYLNHASEERRAIHDFGQDLEQKLISSKHGLQVESGRAPALEMINAVYNDDFSQARSIQQKYFSDDFDLEMMEKAFQGLSRARENLENGLYNPSMRLGTSYGVNPDIGLSSVNAMLQGESSPNQSVQTNSTLTMLRKMLGVSNEVPLEDLEGNEQIQLDPYESRNAHVRSERPTGIGGAIQEYGTDFSGGSEVANNRLGQLMEEISTNRNARWGIAGAGLALAALGGYNILRHKDPIVSPEDDMHYTVNNSNPEPALQMDTGYSTNADINVSARGNSMDDASIAQMISQGMNDSNMETNNPRVTINSTDNTQQLNRIWYRDKVQESIQGG